MGSPVPHEDEYFDLAKKVFIEFARFEYCLKASGFLKTPNGRAEPNWDAFSNCDEMKAFFKEVNSNKANGCPTISYLLLHPPKCQIAEEGILRWKDAPNISNSQDFFVAVRRVRNNLFHGGKFNQIFFELERSTVLLEAVLSVLKIARYRHEKINEAYSKKSS